MHSLCFSVTRSDSGTGGGYIPSAEQVALSLLSQFNEYHLPKADQLVWLVSEKEAPQAVSSFVCEFKGLWLRNWVTLLWAVSSKFCSEI